MEGEEEEQDDIDDEQEDIEEDTEVMDEDEENDPEDGEPWGFSKPGSAKAKIWIENNKPLLSIVSPMSSAFGQPNNINFSRVNSEDVQRIVERGTRRSEFCVQLYRIQMKNIVGRIETNTVNLV